MSLSLGKFVLSSKDPANTANFFAQVFDCESFPEEDGICVKLLRSSDTYFNHIMGRSTKKEPITSTLTSNLKKSLRITLIRHSFTSIELLRRLLEGQSASVQKKIMAITISIFLILMDENGAFNIHFEKTFNRPLRES